MDVLWTLDGGCLDETNTAVVVAEKVEGACDAGTSDCPLVQFDCNASGEACPLPRGPTGSGFKSWNKTLKRCLPLLELLIEAL